MGVARSELGERSPQKISGDKNKRKKSGKIKDNKGKLGKIKDIKGKNSNFP